MDIIDQEVQQTVWKRLGWFVAIWLGGVLSLAAVAALVRVLLKP